MKITTAPGTVGSFPEPSLDCHYWTDTIKCCPSLDPDHPIRAGTRGDINQRQLCSTPESRALLNHSNITRHRS